MKMINKLRRDMLRTCVTLGTFFTVMMFSTNLLALDCKFVTTNDWGSGFTAEISVTNNSSSPITGWNLSWQLNGGSQLSGSWNANVSGSNPYSATNVSWNGNLNAGASTSFGLQGNGDNSTATLLSCVAQGVSNSSVSSSSLSSSSSSSSLLSSSSSSSLASSSLSSSSSVASGCMCNWYGSTYALCNNTNDGWGWENNKSCIGQQTCKSQSGNGGVVCTGSSSSSNPSSSSSSSSLSSSSSSIPSSSSSSSSLVTSSSSSSSVGIYPNYNTNPIASDMSSMSSNAVQLANRIRLGWNIGNTMEAIGGESYWGNPMVTNELIQTVKAAGFDAIRIPVSWNQYANQSTAKIDAAWLNRVRDVVQYCIDNDMPVILNIHWDGGWLENNVTPEMQAQVNAKQRAFWQQIATHLRDFDERLIFAGANEPNVETAAQMAVLTSYHQTFIDAVRATGGRNSYRVLVVQGPNTDVERTNSLMSTLPVDTVADRLMVEVHFYTPYNFALMTEDASWGNQSFYWGQGNHSPTDTAHNPTWGEEATIDQLFSQMKQQFVDKGIPVVLGEFCATRRSTQLSGENLRLHLQSRAYWHKYITKQALANGLLPFYWDMGGLGNFASGIFDRSNNTVFDQQTLDALLEGAQ